MAAAPLPPAKAAATPTPLDLDTEAALLRQHDGLVHAAVARVWPRVRHGGRLDQEDLLQAGRLGLLKAIRRFDRARGLTFSTYAHPAIRRTIAKAIDAELRRPEEVSLDTPLTEDGVDAIQDLLPDDRPGPEALLLAGTVRT
jgi:RNA polymerase sigma factor (sigma-70 family)